MALAPLADLKTYLGIDNTDSDAELTRMLEVQSGFAEQYMGRSIVRASFTERRNGNCSDVLFVRNAPISAISLLTINGATIAASDGTSSGYIFEAESVFLLGGQRFTRGTKNVVITYTGGYQTVPPEIAHPSSKWRRRRTARRNGSASRRSRSPAKRLHSSGMASPIPQKHPEFLPPAVFL